MDRDSCLMLLKLSGFSEKSDMELTISVPTSAIFKACGHVIGAMTYFSMELLELVRACLPEIASNLLLVFGKALKGEKSVTVENTQSLVESNVGSEILQRLNIQMGSDAASIPEAVPEMLDKVFWVLFAVQGNSEAAGVW
ncbi:uncharacterized protein LOC132563633 [Ylistrum balloti]|uniref:uncharacterized protein LOC132563633 n=1 Tax=Ylistrum balloti TaxID=509963 RepID=UPI002905C66C|nr:uncharacterized protein LOC132563633 [Ylistrum balloti]